MEPEYATKKIAQVPITGIEVYTELLHDMQLAKIAIKH
jgi:hypothetical protein